MLSSEYLNVLLSIDYAQLIMAAFVEVLEKEHIENFLVFCLNKWNANRQSTMIVAVVEIYCNLKTILV